MICRHCKHEIQSDFYELACKCGRCEPDTEDNDVMCGKCSELYGKISILEKRNALLKEACELFEKNSAACVTEFEGRLKAEKERDKLLKQLPDGMKHCTIQFEECKLGHGNLTAANWVKHPCSTCERNKLKDAIIELVACMNNQEKRESGEFHWPAHSFKPVWDAAKEHAMKLVKGT